MARSGFLGHFHHERPAADIAAGQRLVQTMLQGYRGPVAVRLWDGSLAHGRPGAPVALVFHQPAPLRDLVLHADLFRLAEAYLAGGVDAEGDMEVLFDLVEFLRCRQWSWRERLRLFHEAVMLPGMSRKRAARERRASRRLRRNGRQAIAHHYDVGNEFYRLWLDPNMVYSCAYFSTPDQPLVEAQEDKLDYICRKLRLSPGQHLLDIGCGWGALALRAARRHGVRVHGITLSREQCAHARERVRQEGLEGQVRIDLLDYRELPDDARYDRIVSVGMFEHIGRKNFPLYFGKVRRMLRPGGLFLNHGITNDTGWQDTPISRFINAYVFPDGELARISDVQLAMEEAGFEILDVESLRPHYQLTLRRWRETLEARKEEAVALTSDQTYRIWRLYMAGSSYYFGDGSLGVYQVLAGHRYQPQPVGLRRDELYH
ncbi:MAG TPA: class I SAM-dependent methyltransferase [Thiotrichales bacterium]|nr:class I SAM-dependent methyltransferase [Thiotrichales bacterium]